MAPEREKMTRVLVATASVHTTAAACDYLGPRLGPDDTVLVLGVIEPDVAGRDPGDAANVARTRLVEPAVETLVREGDPATETLTVADERDVDLVVAGARRGTAEAAGNEVGSTTRHLLREAERPVVVVPLEPA
jgi:nucleotide-binding universal stress UspA family protein